MTPAAERQILGLFVNPVPPHQGPCPFSPSRPTFEQPTHLALWCILLSLLRIVRFELILCQETALLYKTDKWANINPGSVSRYPSATQARRVSEKIEIVTSLSLAITQVLYGERSLILHELLLLRLLHLLPFHSTA
jgi:hypothetical protein